MRRVASAARRFKSKSDCYYCCCCVVCHNLSHLATWNNCYHIWSYFFASKLLRVMKDALFSLFSSSIYLNNCANVQTLNVLFVLPISRIRSIFYKQFASYSTNFIGILLNSIDHRYYNLNDTHRSWVQNHSIEYGKWWEFISPHFVTYFISIVFALMLRHWLASN